MPLAHNPSGSMMLVVRSAGDPLSVVSAVREAARATDSTLALQGVRPLTDLLVDMTAQRRLNTMLLAVFGVVAVSLTALGSYGVMSQLVASRRRELAVRLAVGATPRRVGVMVLGQNARLAIAGIAVGLAASWQIGRLIAPLVFGISSTSPLALLTVGVTTLVVTTGATIVPAVRAAFVDVTRGLRN